MAKVAIVIRSISFDAGVGGMERAAADHIRFLAARDTGLELITPHRRLPGIPESVSHLTVPWPLSGTTSRGPLHAITYWLWTRRVRRVLRRSSHDLVHFHGAAVGALARTRNFVAVANPHGMEEFARAGWLRRLSRFPTRHQSRRARFADCVIATDDRLAEDVARNTRVRADKVVVLPNAVDTARLRALARAASHPDQFTIVSIGRVTMNKGYDVLARAIEILAREGTMPPGYIWRHFGSGPETGALIDLAGSLAEVDLRLVGDADDETVQSTLASADVFVQPSRYEGSSLTVLEAMAHGRTVVATPVGGIPDKITDGVTGFLAETVSPDALAHALRRALKQDTDVGSAARTKVEQSFSWDNAADSYVRLYAALMSGNQDPEGEPT